MKRNKNSLKQIIKTAFALIFFYSCIPSCSTAAENGKDYTPDIDQINSVFSQIFEQKERQLINSRFTSLCNSIVDRSKLSEGKNFLKKEALCSLSYASDAPDKLISTVKGWNNHMKKFSEIFIQLNDINTKEHSAKKNYLIEIVFDFANTTSPLKGDLTSDKDRKNRDKIFLAIPKKFEKSLTTWLDEAKELADKSFFNEELDLFPIIYKGSEAGKYLEYISSTLLAFTVCYIFHKLIVLYQRNVHN